MSKKRMVAAVTAWAAVFAWMWLIYSFSAQTAEVSSSVSGEVIRTVVAMVRPQLKSDPLTLEELVRSLQGIVRKCAHFSLYAALGLLTSAACTVAAPHRGGRYAAAWGLCTLYAVSDELHQLYVPGRSGELRDVCIDSCGALLGVAYFAFGFSLALRFLSRRSAGRRC